MASIKAKLAALRAKRASSNGAPKKVDADLLAAAAAVGSPRATWDTHLSERSYALSPDDADGTAVDSRSLSSDDESDCLVVLAPPVKQLHPAAQRQMWRMKEAERARLKAAKDLAETGMADFDEADETHVEGDAEQGDTADGEEGDVEEVLLNRDEGDGSDDELGDAGDDGNEDAAVAGDEENDQVVEGASKVEDDTACDKTEEKSDDVEGVVENQVEPDAFEDKAVEEAGSKECSSDMDGRKRTLERLARLGGFVEDEAEDDDGGEGSVASGREGDDRKSCMVYDEDIASGGRDKKKLACFHREWEMGQEKTKLEGLTGGEVGDVDCAIDLAELEKRGDEMCVSEADEGEVNGERERAESYMDSMFLRDESRGAYGEDEDSGVEEIEKARALWKARQKVKSGGEKELSGLEMFEEGVANRGKQLRMKLEEMCRPNASGEGVRKRSKGTKRRKGISVGTWSLAADEETSGIGSGAKNSVGCAFVRRRKRAKGQVAATGQRQKTMEREKAGRANFNNILSILGERARTD